jgi:transposase
MSTKGSAEKTIQTIRRKTRRQHSAEEKIRIVMAGLRGKETVAELCRREGISQSLYYKWSKEFLGAGKSRLSGDVKRQATTGEVKALRQEFITPYTPQQNGLIERFFRSLKEECVWITAFDSFQEAKQAVARWIRWYNQERPHQALGYLSPSEFHRQRQAVPLAA